MFTDRGELHTDSGTGAELSDPTAPAELHHSPGSLLSPSAIYRAFLDHLAARRRSLSTSQSPPGESRSEDVQVRPVTLAEGLWIFGGSVAFSVAKVLGLSLLYYVAPGFVETWGPTFG
ncbi:hypothetical protein FJT64_016123 [Amphibalanus amphitrite]|uniref:Uncharacterized protein n=1 Tax=Amphibalanus amphitrite TaxID=1232801 RepID=A0A6A4X237_AMPAM|nr:hypothetical protein FJT64_016123 [Amphibalanus amphitrite]